MRKHCVLGARLLGGGNSELMQMAEEIALFHRERWDGSGYPSRLKDGEIPLSARIVAVVDAFDALTHKRLYKEVWPLEDTIAELQHERGKQFDPKVVDALVRLYGQGQLSSDEQE